MLLGQSRRPLPLRAHARHVPRTLLPEPTSSQTPSARRLELAAEGRATGVLRLPEYGGPLNSLVNSLAAGRVVSSHSDDGRARPWHPHKGIVRPIPCSVHTVIL